jgi:hypothetical protein
LTEILFSGAVLKCIQSIMLTGWKVYKELLGKRLFLKQNRPNSYEARKETICPSLTEPEDLISFGDGIIRKDMGYERGWLRAMRKGRHWNFKLVQPLRNSHSGRSGHLVNSFTGSKVVLLMYSTNWLSLVILRLIFPNPTMATWDDPILSLS